MLRVALVDGSLQMQQAMRLLLSTVAGIEVVGGAADLGGALALIEETEPHVVVLGTQLRSGGHGLDLLRLLGARSRVPDVVVVAQGAGALHDTFVAAGARVVFRDTGDGRELTQWMRAKVAESGVLSLAND